YEMASLERRFSLFPLKLLIHQRLDSIDKISSLKIPVLVIHGTSDEIIPDQLGQRLFAAASQPKHLTLIPGGHHEDSASVGGETYRRAVVDFTASLRTSGVHAAK